MIRILLAILYFILSAYVIAHIDNGIKGHDMSFYHGKDNGYFVRFESIILLNTLFFLLMAIGKESKVLDYVLKPVLGFIIGIVLGILCYFIFVGVDYYGLAYHIGTLTICSLSYFVLNRSVFNSKP